MIPTVFISYSHDNAEHTEWILSLSKDLLENGVDVILDQYELSAGKEMTFFMERAVLADKILIILTPEYNSKATNRKGGVGFEYSIISQEYYDHGTSENKIIPVLRSGDKEQSCPTYLKTSIFRDMRVDEKYETKFFELIRIILDRPLIEKPLLGKLPNLDGNTLPDLETKLNDLKLKELHTQKKNKIIANDEGWKLFINCGQEILKNLNESLQKYQSAFNIKFFIKFEPNEYILFTTGEFTYLVKMKNRFAHSANGATLHLNFFKGPIGFDERFWDYTEKIVNLYLTEYKFDLDENLEPVFIMKENSKVRLYPIEIPQKALRDLLFKEIELRESRL